MKKILIIITILVFSFLSFSCSNDSTLPADSAANITDVYIAGSKYGKACYWKNGQIVMLNSGTFTGTTAKKIIVSNGNVYVLGETTASAIVTNYLYWKNGVLSNLTTSYSSNSYTAISIHDMDVVGNDVYFVGYTNPAIIAVFMPSLVYWKNNAITTVKTYNNGIYNQSSKIKVLNNDVYITGASTINNPNGAINGYFKNTVFTEIQNSGIRGLDIKNNQMFVYGYKILAGFYTNTATKQTTTVSFPADGGIQKMCFDNNNDYYTNGQEIRKNGTLFNSSQMPNYITDFTMLSNNLYKLNTALFGALINVQSVSINNVVTLTTATGEFFNALFIVQN